MDISHYTSILSNRLNSYFDIQYDNQLLSNTFNIFASTKLILGRTMISQKDIIDKFESNEYVLVKYFESIDDYKIDDFIEYIKTTPNLLVKPHKDHKSSYINAIIVCNTLPNKSTIKKIKEFKFEKIYKFYFQGFCEIRLFIVGLSDNLVESNKAGKKLKKVYLPTS
ncbi:hypothetical protein [Clostridium sp. D53t1_180928_C8]|uniref:hypothetical protein n=1 Tax=Clostridium sp. D53t1_180928_C8 TaxID=2787101 RepID=UPI0018AC7BBE|nr:hypothetical protein [Clostridium sp. D53t1_180928_C8]